MSMFWQGLNSLYEPEYDTLKKSDWLSFSATVGSATIAAVFALLAAGFTISKMNGQIKLMGEQISPTEAYEKAERLAATYH